MQTKLPTLLNVFETDYELQYSESYTSTILQEAAIEGYQYCTSLDRAFQSLISENFNNFVLTMGQRKLPTLLNVFEIDYELQYSESYTSTILQEAAIEGYQYCTSLDRAFQSLISENFNNFVLTMGCTAVAIYCKGNVGLNVFDSHAKDIYDRSHPQGTCVLLEVSSLNSLVHYFQSVHNNDIFELNQKVQCELCQTRREHK